MERMTVATLISRCRESRRFIQVVAGPRQVGKTTAVHSALNQLDDETMFVAADQANPPSRNWLESIWESARIRLKSSERPRLILAIDEIQQIDDWSRTVKALWDEDTLLGYDILPIILGSSALLLQQGLSESLMGRFELHAMNHWSYAEMQQCFGWTPEQFAWYGGYPGVASLIDDWQRWRRHVLDAFIEASLARDVLGMTRIQKPGLLRNLFELGCIHSGQILAYTKMLGQLDDAGNTTTLAGYLQVLHQAGLLAGLEKYSGSVARKRSSSPKFQVHNNALMNAWSGVSLDQIVQVPERWGRVVESAVGTHLLNECQRVGAQLGYWRSGDDEVDFVMEWNDHVVAIEVKANAAKTIRGLAAFQKVHPRAKTILISEQTLPWTRFLTMPIEVVMG